MNATVRLFALVLVVAVGAAPTLLDGCLITCHAQTPGSSRARNAGGHSCHEEATHPGSRYQLGSQPKPCGHDRGETGAQVAAATDGSSPLKSLKAPIAVITSASVSLVLSGTSPTRGLVLTRNAGTSSTFVLPLRV